MKQKNSDHLTEVITLRFTNHDNQLIVKEAESQNIGRAEMIRKAWRDYLLQQSLTSKLNRLEQRLTKRTFEIVSAVAGIDEQERLIAMKKFKERLRKESTI
jgi:hypothetical protein